MPLSGRTSSRSAERGEVCPPSESCPIRRKRRRTSIVARVQDPRRNTRSSSATPASARAASATGFSITLKVSSTRISSPNASTAPTKSASSFPVVQNTTVTLRSPGISLRIDENRRSSTDVACTFLAEGAYIRKHSVSLQIPRRPREASRAFRTSATAIRAPMHAIRSGVSLSIHSTPNNFGTGQRSPIIFWVHLFVQNYFLPPQHQP